MKLVINLSDRKDMRVGLKLLQDHLGADESKDKGAAPIVPEETTSTTAPDNFGTGESIQGTIEIAELDCNDLPWDERIHASSKAKNKDGSWRYRKGIDRATIPQVEAELKSVIGKVTSVSETTTPAETAETAPPPPPPAETPAAPVLADTDIYLQNGIEFSVKHLRDGGWTDEQILTLEKKPVAVTTPPPPAAEAAGMTTFPQLLQRITASINEGQLTNEQVDNAVKSEGVAELTLLAARPDLVPKVEARLFG